MPLEQWNGGIVESGGVEWWNSRVVEEWNGGIVELWKSGMVE